MSKIFKNVPQEIENDILNLSNDNITVAYRAVPNPNNLRPTDFYPTFIDDLIKRNIEETKQKGNMACVIASQSKSNNVSRYSLSLLNNRDVAFNKFFRRQNKKYHGLAKGFCDNNKGVSHLDNDSHVSFYLYDYENCDKNPYNDFEIIEQYE